MRSSLAFEEAVLNFMSLYSKKPPTKLERFPWPQFLSSSPQDKWLLNITIQRNEKRGEKSLYPRLNIQFCKGGNKHIICNYIQGINTAKAFSRFILLATFQHTQILCLNIEEKVFLLDKYIAILKTGSLESLR